MIGIAGYGIYFPKYRIQLAQIAQVWKKEIGEISSGLLVEEKTVQGIDEDAITMGVEAGRRAIHMAGIQPEEIRALYVGSESHPYAVNPSSTTIASYLGLGNEYFTADLEFACKAATAGMQVLNGLLLHTSLGYGIVIGSDTAQAKPHDVLEYTSASAAAAYILTNKADASIATIVAMTSFASDTPDFWRRDGQRYPSHFGRFTGEPAYFTHVAQAGKQLLEQSHLTPRDFDYCVFHAPNGKFPRVVAKQLGFTPEQLAPSLVVGKIGNPYSASSLVGLASVLDNAKPHQKIFFVSYGSGAGADGFIFQTTPKIVQRKRDSKKVSALIDEKTYISYPEYLRHTHTI